MAKVTYYPQSKVAWLRTNKISITISVAPELNWYRAVWNQLRKLSCTQQSKWELVNNRYESTWRLDGPDVDLPEPESGTPELPDTRLHASENGVDQRETLDTLVKVVRLKK